MTWEALKEQKILFGVGVAALVLVALGLYFFGRAPAAAPTISLASSTPIMATSTTSSAVSAAPPAASSGGEGAALDPRDSITSWNFASAYQAGNATETSAIAELSAEIGQAGVSTYDTYIQIAQDYYLMGEGAEAYAYYDRAISVNGSQGLAYDDLGELMARLGALNTAQAAYARAVAIQPTVESYQLDYVNFLAMHDATASVTVAAFTNAKKALGPAPDLLIAEADWLTTIGSTTAAIAAWQAVLPSVSAAQQTAIEAKITALQHG